MEIQVAREEHFEQIARLVASSEELFLTSPNSSFPWTADQLKHLSESRKNFTVCLVDGEVAAFASLYDVLEGEFAFIGNVIVGRHFRKNGIGKALVEHMCELCRWRYKAVPHLSVFASNTRALVMYSDMGFLPYAIEPYSHTEFGETAVVHMRYQEWPWLNYQAE